MQCTTRTEGLGCICYNTRTSPSNVTRCCATSRTGGNRHLWRVAYAFDLARIAASLDIEEAALHVLGEPDWCSYGVAILTKGGEVDVWFVMECVKRGDAI